MQKNDEKIKSFPSFLEKCAATNSEDRIRIIFCIFPKLNYSTFKLLGKLAARVWTLRFFLNVFHAFANLNFFSPKNKHSGSLIWKLFFFLSKYQKSLLFCDKTRENWKIPFDACPFLIKFIICILKYPCNNGIKQFQNNKKMRKNSSSYVMHHFFSANIFKRDEFFFNYFIPFHFESLISSTFRQTSGDCWMYYKFSSLSSAVWRLVSQ